MATGAAAAALWDLTSMLPTAAPSVLATAVLDGPLTLASTVRGPLRGYAKSPRVPLLPESGGDWWPPHRVGAAAAMHHLASRVLDHSYQLIQLVVEEDKKAQKGHLQMARALLKVGVELK